MNLLEILTQNIDKEQIQNIQPEQIDFREEELNNYNQMRVQVIIPNFPYLTSLINFKVEPRKVGNNTLYQIHLFLDNSIQHLGLGYKIILAFINTFGHIYTGYGRILNDKEVPAIFSKLKQTQGIEVTEVKNDLGKAIGLIAIKK